MKNIRTFALCCALSFLSATSIAVAGDGLPRAKPETVGFSAERLQRITETLHGKVDSGALAGMVTLIARHGEVVYEDAYGVQDTVSKRPMSQDTIFRIYSMTKPTTGVAMMMLYEQGKWNPEDPLSRYIPEFADLKVFAGVDAQGKMILEAPVHPPTVGELMSHTAGFSYGLSGDTPVDKIYQSLAPLDAPSLQEMINRLAKIPLLYQPGTKWVYSLSVDVQGYLVEKLSGKSLPQFQQERLFGPLGMKDTAFYVPKEKMSRLAVVYNGGTDGKTLVAEPHPATINSVPGLASGGGGLWSTSGDYLRFAQMLANGGQLGGVRILAPRTLELMRTNHLSEKLMTGEFGIGMQRMRPGFGFGYDFAVFEDPLKAGNPVGKGTFLWDGAAATFFWVDPTYDIVFVGMLQRRGAGNPNVQQLARPLTMQALIDASK